MKRLSLILSLLMMPLFASAKTLTKMVILPPSTGYWIFSPTNTGSVQLSLFCTYDDASTDTTCTGAGGTVTWFAEYPASMTVNSTGLATGQGTNTPIPSTAVKDGIGAYNGTVFAHVSINVNQYALTCINIRPETTGSNIVLGNTILLSANDCSPASGDGNPPVTGPAIGNFPAWTSSNTGVATVNTIGEVTGISAGTSVITATLPGITQTRTVTVTNPTPALNTYYVRPGGGNRTQCTGLSDVDYPGSGSGVACAVNNPMYCFTDNTSTSVYTGLVQAGDTCFVHPPTAGTQYPVAQFSPGVQWNTPAQAPGAILPPSGTPAHPTKLISSTASTCEVSDPLHQGTCVALNSLGAVVFELYDVQNFDVEGFDLWSGADCIRSASPIFFNCPSGAGVREAMFVDQFTSNFTLQNSRVHGYFSSIAGTPGPGTVWTNVAVLYNTLAGLNFDNPFGFNGNRSDGFSLVNSYIGYSGFSEELVKPLTGGSVSRDGSGNLNVTFPSGSIVNYVPGTSLVLAGMTPSDLNGTYPVTSVNFNQQTLNITGGSLRGCNDGFNSVGCADFSTSTAPAFIIGPNGNSFVTIAGVTPSFLNGTYEVMSVNGTTGFTVTASLFTRPGWAITGTISSGGTASTALSLVATASGASESASVLGTASHVIPAHRAMDQFDDTHFSNGDCVGTGNNTIGSWSSVGSQFHRCTQDGWDMLHSAMTSMTFKNNFSEGNEGQPAKGGLADTAIFTNNFIVANAGANMAFDANLPPEYNQYLTTLFRANDGFLTANEAWATMIISNNTFMSAQNVGWDDFYDSELRPLPFSNFIFQNNLIADFTDGNNPGWNASLVTIYLYSGGFPQATWTTNNNLAWNARNPPGGGSGNNWTLSGCPNITCVPSATTPNIVNLAGEIAAVFPNWNLNINGSSPAIGAGIANSFTPSTDYNGVATTSPPVIGAVNFAAGPPTVATPTASPAAGAYGSTQSVTLSTTTGGATICYTIDGSTPTATTPGTCSHGTTYSTAITVAVTTTIKAIGTLSGDTNSSLGTFPYTILVPIQNVVVSGKSVFGGKSSLQ